ncbi:FadR/GntR family transcriptional regulator [Wukongibacter baidiensis]|uniref:FadR/GntR family transcriptional regulator n=1 Tax=Wukongibacter baidiensis TaxID=1723361 RepID=UPI003D7FB840
MFTPIKNKKLYQLVIDQIQEMILDGKLKKGDKLPSERDLSNQLGISRTSIREALRALEIIGLIESRQGEGNFIKGRMESSIFEPLSVMFILSGGRPQDILEVRRIIEVEGAILAAKEINDDQKEELIEIMNQLRNAKDEKESSEFDRKLHFMIAKCTGNHLIMNLFNVISTLMKDFIKDARWEILKANKSQEFLVNQHQLICDAIIENDPDKAGLAMKAHIEYIYNVVEELNDKW